MVCTPLFKIVTYYTSIMRRSTMLLKSHVSWIFSKSFKSIVRKYVSTSLSCYVLVFKTVGLFTSISRSKKYDNRERFCSIRFTCCGRSEPHIWQFWLFTVPENEKFSLIAKTICLRNSKSSLSSFRQYFLKEIPFSLSKSVIWGCLLRLYGKRFSSPCRKGRTVVWCTPVWAAIFGKDNLGLSLKNALIRYWFSLLIWGHPFQYLWEWPLVWYFSYPHPRLERAGATLWYFIRNFLWISVYP